MIGCIGILALLAPGVVLGLVYHSWAWGAGLPAVLLGVVGAILVNRRKRRITPQAWAAQLEKHLLGTKGPYDWKEATGHTFADKRLDNLRVRVAQEYKTLESQQKKDAFRQIIETLKRGDIP
jgi:hypothetical protein